MELPLYLRRKKQNKVLKELCDSDKQNVYMNEYRMNTAKPALVNQSTLGSDDTLKVWG